jgi:hypothetical protein
VGQISIIFGPRTHTARQSPRPLAQIADTAIVSRNPSILTTQVGSEIVMMSIEQNHYFSLDQIGSDIWTRIEPPCLFAALIDGLAADYEAERTTIETDVQNLLSDMVARDIVRLT